MLTYCFFSSIISLNMLVYQSVQLLTLISENNIVSVVLRNIQVLFSKPKVGRNLGNLLVTLHEHVSLFSSFSFLNLMDTSAIKRCLQILSCHTGLLCQLFEDSAAGFCPTECSGLCRMPTPGEIRSTAVVLSFVNDIPVETCFFRTLL